MASPHTNKKVKKDFKHETIMKVINMKKDKYNLLRARCGKRQIADTEVSESGAMIS